MTTRPKSELDAYFPHSADEPELSNGNDQLGELYEEFTAQIRATLDELMPGANAAKRKAIITGACSTAEMAVLFDKQPAEYWIAEIKKFVANVENKSAKKSKPQPAKTETPAADAPLPKSESEVSQAKPVSLPGSLPEAPFSATVKLLPDGTVDSWLITVRGNSVEEGTDLMAQLMKMVRAKVEMKPTKRADAPSTASRRMTADNAPPQSSGKPVNAPVKSFDPDADGKPKSGEVLHFEATHIEKVLTQKGKVEINFYMSQPNGQESKFPELRVYLDSQLEEVYKHVDVEAMQLAVRYDYPATIDYTLSKNKTQKGNPYKDLVAVHPKK